MLSSHHVGKIFNWPNGNMVGDTSMGMGKIKKFTNNISFLIFNSNFENKEFIPKWLNKLPGNLHKLKFSLIQQNFNMHILRTTEQIKYHFIYRYNV